MKKKYKYTLLATYLLAATSMALSSCDAPQTNAQPRKKTYKKVYVYKKPELTVRTDTLNISDENYKEFTTRGAGGVFFSGLNTVVVYHFNPVSDSSKIQKYCEINNNLKQLYRRHELEHARKSDLTHNTEFFSAMGRARVAAINEIMAPASEIIEAVDYHARTGHPFPNAKKFIVKADSAIFQAIGVTARYVNYNYQPISDAVITYALENFLGSVNRGYYKYTVKKAYNNKSAHNTVAYNRPLTNIFKFNPDANLWDPIWEFESIAGKCNPYRTASWRVRQNLMQKVDSVIYASTGTDYFTNFWQNGFSR